MKIAFSEFKHFCKSHQRLVIIGLVLGTLAGCKGAEVDNTNAGPAPGDFEARIAACESTESTWVNNNMFGADPVAGGQLYDKWWAAISAPVPTGNHPYWSVRDTSIPGSVNNRSGADTWRCKECHGWDYKGRDGAYGIGSSHYTGFPGIRNARTLSAARVFCTIKAGHNYDTRLSDGTILNLTSFVTHSSRGQQNFDSTIANDGKIIQGNETSGQTLYSSLNGCASGACHGADGKLPASMDGWLGTLADENPWESAHKILFGHPGSSMPKYISQLNWNVAPQVRDVLAYMQASLPSTFTGGGGGGGGSTDLNACMTDTTEINIVNSGLTSADAVAGGRMYDKWWVESGDTAPTTNHPLWSTRDTSSTTVNNRSGADTWRCKECHGWDYRGNVGAYGVGSSHYTGFKGITGARSSLVSNVEVYCRIKTQHAFSQYLTNQEVLDLTRFVKDPQLGQQDLTRILDNSGNLISAPNATNGQTLYFDANYGCGQGACHANDGKSPNLTEWIGTLADENPWEVTHKILYGHAGDTLMPSFIIERNYTLEPHVEDLLAYMKASLPSQAGGGGGASNNALVRGGVLYDNWISRLAGENRATPISTVNPLYQALASQPQGNRWQTTWRCKECHGWDYKGRDGQYGPANTSHYTGVAGIIDTPLIRTREWVRNWIANGFVLTNGERVHNFGLYLDATDLDGLVTFIMDGGLYDLDRDLISSVPGQNILKPYSTNGATLFSESAAGTTMGCGNVLCHGLDGRSINFGTGTNPEYLGDLARGNPWELIHKIRFGDAGASEMPSAELRGFPITDSIDVGAHAQTLN